MDIQQLRSSKILVIGDSCIDKYHFGKCVRMSPEAPVPVFKLIKTEEHPGMAGNVYQNLINLGNTVDILTHSDRITKERFVDIDSKQHIMRLDTGEAVDVTPFRQYENLQIEKYECVIISDYNKGFLDSEAVEKIIDISLGHGVEIFVDSKKRDLSCYKECFLKINESEFNNIKSAPHDCDIIITLGKRGASYRDKIYESFPSDVDNTGLPANVCGAGDTFLAGLVTFYMTAKDMHQSIKFANFCASIAVKNFGTYSICEEDVKKWNRREDESDSAN